MRKLLIILALCCIIGSTLAADTLINPNRINLSKNWTGQMHNVTNGTAAQDVVTYSQTTDSFSRDSIKTIGPDTDYNAKYYDYTTDGTNDDEQFSLATTWFSSRNYGGKIIVMPGNYKMVNQIIIPKWVTVEGVNVPFQSVWGAPFPSLARKEVSRFIITNTTHSPIWLRQTASSIRNIQFIYPDQNTTVAPAVAYPGTIKVGYGSDSSMDNVIEYNNFVNSYIAVDATTYHQRLVMQFNVGYPLYRCLIDNQCYDIDYVMNNHFNPNYASAFGINPTGALATWVNDNAYGFYIGRSDGIRLENNFVYHYQAGIVICDTLYRPTIAKNYIDESRTGIVVTDAGLISNGLIIDNIMLLTTLPSQYCMSGILNIGIGAITDSTISGNQIMGPGYGIGLGPNNVLNDNNIISDNSIKFGDGTYQQRGLYVWGNGNVINDNSVRGLHTLTQGIYVNGLGNTINSNSISYVNNLAVEVTGSPVTVMNNCGWHTGGFQSETNTTTVQIGHNTNTAY
jgi:hypothetical protein